jgi:hypothetical protein
MNLFDLKYKLWADYYLNVKLFNKVNFKYMPLLISYYSEDGISSKFHDEALINDRTRIIMENFGSLYAGYFILRKFTGSLLKKIFNIK